MLTLKYVRSHPNQIMSYFTERITGIKSLIPVMHYSWSDRNSSNRVKTPYFSSWLHHSPEINWTHLKSLAILLCWTQSIFTLLIMWQEEVTQLARLTIASSAFARKLDLFSSAFLLWRFFKKLFSPFDPKTSAPTWNVEICEVVDAAQLKHRTQTYRSEMLLCQDLTSLAVKVPLRRFTFEVDRTSFEVHLWGGNNSCCTIDFPLEPVIGCILCHMRRRSEWLKNGFTVCSCF